MGKNYRRMLSCITILTLLSSILFSGCSLLGGQRREVPKIDMIVDNSLPIQRIDEFVVLKISDLKEAAPDFSSSAFVVLDSANQEIPYQLDDMDNDGQGDEIAMIMNMEPGERKNIMIRYAPEGRAVTLGYEKRTRAAIHPEYGGVGWESEIMAYRAYPDHRNSISIIGKRELGLFLDKFASSVGEVDPAPWGAKVLEGGDSIGCGGFGLWYEDKLVKPLNMEGASSSPDDRIAPYTRIIADGPIRAVVQVVFDNWRVGDQILRVTGTFSIFAGQRWTRSEIKIDGANSPVKIATGLMKSGSATIEKNEEDGFFYTWGAQSHLDPPDDLGMALIYPTENIDSFHEDDETGGHLAVLNPGADNQIVYWFMAAWSRGEIGVKQDKLFAQEVSAVARRIKYPLTVTIMPSEPRPAAEAQEES